MRNRWGISEQTNQILQIKFRQLSTGKILRYKGYIYILGKFEENTHEEGKYQPIKVVSFNSKQNRYWVMLNLFKLKNWTGSGLANLQVGNDLPHIERDAVANKSLKNRSDDLYCWRMMAPWALQFAKRKGRHTTHLLNEKEDF